MVERLAAVKTPVTVDDVRTALTAAWLDRFGTPADPKSIAVLLAQSAHETGQWKSVVAYNLGGAKADPHRHDHTFFTTHEVVSEAEAKRLVRTASPSGPVTFVRVEKDGRVRVRIEPDHPSCCFRAYASIEAGAKDYMGLLAVRFSRAWPAVRAGDPALFVSELKNSGYFTAPLHEYLAHVEALYNLYAPDGTRWLQESLWALGYDPGPIDGVYGPKTSLAVKAFQSDHGMPADGRASKGVKMRIRQVLGPPEAA